LTLGLAAQSSFKKEALLRVCEFCVQFREDGTCLLGLPLPKTMTCREFGPALEKFCSDRKDFVDPRQIMQMATYFGIKGPELKKVKQMAAREHAPL
jgi:hypothetical protein